MRSIDLIVIHCSASPNGQTLFRGQPGTPSHVTPVAVIDGWHRERGFKRDPVARRRFNPELGSIGYHFVVYLNGAVATGRDLDENGAHVSGHNRNSIGVCLVGTDKFSAAQWAGLAGLIHALRQPYPAARVCGHRDLSPDLDGDGVVEPHEWLKTCPGFDVAEWLRTGMNPMPNHLQEA